MIRRERGGVDPTMRTRTALLAVTAGAAALVVPQPAAARTVIPIKGIAFKKPTVRVGVGEVVVWKDRDGYVSHTVTSRGTKRFGSSSYLQRGDQHRVRFADRGVYRYVCRVHPNMRGRITVR